METSLDARTFAVCFLWIGGTVLGLRKLLLPAACRQRWYVTLLDVILVLLLAGVGGWLIQLRHPSHIWKPPLILAAGYCGLMAVGSSLLGRLVGRVLTFLRDYRWQALLLLLGCPALAVWLGAQDPSPEDYLLASEPVDEEAIFEDDSVVETMIVHESDASPVYTDRGRPVRLYTCTYPVPSRQAATQAENEVFRAKGLDWHIIRVAPPSWGYNCHGWVFAAGRHLILTAAEVETILEDNGYVPVSEPRVGDLAIYRSRRGKIIHSGIVRAVAADGLVLVESKWGKLSRFLHPADEHLYQSHATCTYYRSSRAGHCLQGVD
jgi:hypothetical protein